MNAFDVADFQHRRKSEFGSEIFYYDEVDSTNRIAGVTRKTESSWKEHSFLRIRKAQDGAGTRINGIPRRELICIPLCF